MILEKKSPALLKRCLCPHNRNRREVFSHTMETSGRIYPRKQIPLCCGGRVQCAWDPQIQQTPVKGSISAIKAISASLTGLVSTEMYLPLTSCLVLGYLVPHHCNPCAASEAVTRGSITGLWKLVLFINSVEKEALFSPKCMVTGELWSRVGGIH